MIKISNKAKYLSVLLKDGVEYTYVDERSDIYSIYCGGIDRLMEQGLIKDKYTETVTDIMRLDNMEEVRKRKFKNIVHCKKIEKSGKGYTIPDFYGEDCYVPSIGEHYEVKYTEVFFRPGDEESVILDYLEEECKKYGVVCNREGVKKAYNDTVKFVRANSEKGCIKKSILDGYNMVPAIKEITVLRLPRNVVE